eukprot:CAMPEP_0198422098 /NCGR_PEP_ID=MMETSP1452-20131203/2127_1 /TAXON_ID=1181717 /ORGANISM="Synchroma pusillum, Strain CCMP3072" /LENGTH=52 /DNA_ID=CAMNT_0044142349 /DNA_START=122 /DNA_END=276 /DNA_ORIENTATION=-
MALHVSNTVVPLSSGAHPAVLDGVGLHAEAHDLAVRVGEGIGGGVAVVVLND